MKTMNNNRFDKRGGATSPLNSRKVYQVNYVRNRIANLYLTEAEYGVLNTQSAADWVKGCLIRANPPHLKVINCRDLLELLNIYGGRSPHYRTLRNVHLIGIGQSQYVE